jgi:hypothetical protein
MKKVGLSALGTAAAAALVSFSGVSTAQAGVVVTNINTPQVTALNGPPSIAPPRRRPSRNPPSRR